MNVGGRGVGGGGGNNNCVGGNNGVGGNNNDDGGRNNSQPRKFQEKINLQNNRMAEQERAVQEALGFTKMLKGGQPGANNGNNAALGLNGTTINGTHTNATNINGMNHMGRPPAPSQTGVSSIPVAGMAPIPQNLNPMHPMPPTHHSMLGAHQLGLVPPAPDFTGLSRSDPNLAFWQHQQMVRHQQHMMALNLQQQMLHNPHNIPQHNIPQNQPIQNNNFHQNTNNNSHLQFAQLPNSQQLPHLQHQQNATQHRQQQPHNPNYQQNNNIDQHLQNFQNFQNQGSLSAPNGQHLASSMPDLNLTKNNDSQFSVNNIHNNIQNNQSATDDLTQNFSQTSPSCNPQNNSSNNGRNIAPYPVSTSSISRNSLTVQSGNNLATSAPNNATLQAPSSPYGTSPNSLNTESIHSPVAPSSPSRTHPYSSPNCHRRSNSINNGNSKSGNLQPNNNINGLTMNNTSNNGNLTLPNEFSLKGLNFASSGQSSRRSSISSESGMLYSPINAGDNGLNSMPHSPNGGGKITRKSSSLKERQQGGHPGRRSGHTTPGTPSLSRKSLVTGQDNNLLNHSLSTPGSPNCTDDGGFRQNDFHFNLPTASSTNTFLSQHSEPGSMAHSKQSSIITNQQRLSVNLNSNNNPTVPSIVVTPHEPLSDTFIDSILNDHRDHSVGSVSTNFLDGDKSHIDEMHQILDLNDINFDQ